MFIAFIQAKSLFLVIRQQSEISDMFKKLLIANRGEIALRIMRSAKEMGIQTVAVYSEADRLSPHVRYADEAVFIGPAASNQSYLVFDKIIDACKQTGAQAIHPGYGFLSENAAFARRVKQEGLILVGPSPEAMEIMGNKLSAKAAAKKYQIPMVPGTEEAIQDIAVAKLRAEEVGFPILIKAAAGGGGKGMRIVENTADFEEQMNLAVSEAISSFGDGAVFIERYVSSPRHIEIQVLGDTKGNIVHLFERECSVQRRHQKVVEEAPSAVLSPELRKAMGECAVNVAKSCNYVGAGTVEFILENNTDFYFLEMNTRLQVEHPVTEMITGIDLVKEQLKIADGQALSFSQEDLKINGQQIIKEPFYRGYGITATPSDTQWRLALIQYLPQLINYQYAYVLNGNTLTISNLLCLEDTTPTSVSLDIGINININCAR